MPMVITDFAVDNGKMPIHLEDMPTEANTQNTTVYIGGSPQSAPEEVSPNAQIIRLSLQPSTRRGFINVSIRMKSGTPEKAQSQEYYVPKESDSGTGPSKPDVTGCSPLQAKPGNKITLQGKHMNSINTGFLTDNRIVPVTATATTASFIVPADIKAGTYKVGYQAPNVTKAFTKYTVRIT